MVKHYIEPWVLLLEFWHANNSPPWTCVHTLALMRKDWPVADLARTRQLISSKEALRTERNNTLMVNTSRSICSFVLMSQHELRASSSRIAIHRLTPTMARREMTHLEPRLFSRLLDALWRHKTCDGCIIPKLTRVVQSDAPMLRILFARKYNCKISAFSVTVWIKLRMNVCINEGMYVSIYIQVFMYAYYIYLCIYLAMKVCGFYIIISLFILV